MRRVASVLLALCGLALLLTWQAPGGLLWIGGEQAISEPYFHIERFKLEWMSDANVAFKAAGIVLLAAALLAWPTRQSKGPA